MDEQAYGDIVDSLGFELWRLNCPNSDRRECNELAGAVCAAINELIALRFGPQPENDPSLNDARARQWYKQERARRGL